MMNSKVLSIVLFILIGAPIVYQQLQVVFNHTGLLNKLQTLKHINADIDELALRARFNLDKNYDRLSLKTTEAEELNSEIMTLQQVLDEEGEHPRLAGTLASYLQAWETRQSMIENFKSHNSVLRNSQRYAPLAVDDLRAALSASSWQPAPDMLHMIKADLLEYSLTNAQVVKVHLRLSLQELEQFDNEMSADNRSRLMRLKDHAKVILQEQDITNRYLRRAVDHRGDGFLDEAILISQEAQAEQQQNAAQARWVLIAYLVTLLAFLSVALGLQMYRKKPLGV